jgi:hypothetical protein
MIQQRDHKPSGKATNPHSNLTVNVESARWKPILPPKKGASRNEFYASLLLPGLSLAFHAAALGRSRTSIATYRAAALEAARSDPSIMDGVTTAVGSLRAEDGLKMAQLRGGTQLPFWSRMAISEYCKRGFSRCEIAAAFHCSPGTVANVLQGKGSGYSALSGERRLTKAQRNPIGKWQTHRTPFN